MRNAVRAVVLASVASVAFAASLVAQVGDPLGAGNPPKRPVNPNARTRNVPITDTMRAHELFVSKNPKELPGCGNACDRQVAAKKATDSAYAARAKGNYEFAKVTYKSRVDGFTVPAYVFSPLVKKAEKHPALVWIHGGVHSDWGIGMWPFVRDAVQKGYVVITPDYRGSTGYGEAHYKAIDYGGKEVDDVASAVDFLKTLPYVDLDRLGVMGWSHG